MAYNYLCSITYLISKDLLNIYYILGNTQDSWAHCKIHDSELFFKYIDFGASWVALEVKNLPANAEDIGDESSTLVLGRSSGRGRGKTIQYSCLENLLDRGSWWATVHSVIKIQT